MPVMGGCEAAHLIRVMERKRQWKKATIVALTANVRDVPGGEPFDASLSKPLSRSSLKEMLVRVWGMRTRVNGTCKALPCV